MPFPRLRPKRPPLLLALAVAAACLAQAADAPPASQATLLLRILAFDRKLASRASGTVTIAVVYKEGNSRSETTMSQVAGALEEAAKKNSVAGLPVKVVRLAWGAHFEADMEKEAPSAAYLCPGLDEAFPGLARTTQARRALTFSSSEDYIKAGASIALVPREAKLSIVVHLANSRAEGADLDSNLLRIAEVIR